MKLADSPENHNRGIVWMLATMLCFIALDAIMKHLLEDYSLVQVTWARFFFATIFAIGFCGQDLPRLMRTQSFKEQTLRSVLLMSTTGAFNAGIRTTPLATATTIMFLSPILVTLLSIAFLGEKVGIRRWAGIIAGFAGAVIVVRPWEAGLSVTTLGILFLLLAAVLNANYQLVTRMVRQDHPLTSLLFTATAGAAVTSFIVPWFWSWPTAYDWMLLIGSGLAGGLGHLCLIRALRLAPASVVAPFSYSSLIWAALLGYLIWNELPDLLTWIGAAIIISSGLYIFHRERMRETPLVET